MPWWGVPSLRAKPPAMRHAQAFRAFAGAAFISVGATSPIAAQTALPSPTPAPQQNPFCPVSVAAVPWDSKSDAAAPTPVADSLVMVVFAERGSSAEVHVTLVTDTDAYDVPIAKIPLYATPRANSSSTLVVTLPKPMTLRYEYVDSYALDGAVSTDCPSVVSAIRTWTQWKWHPVLPTAASPRIAAVFKQTLPPLPCGKMYQEATVTHVIQPPWINVRSTKTVEVNTFIDSGGHVIKAYVYRTSGIPQADALAVETAEAATYAPAMFLCTPVVGDYLFRVDFVP